MKFLAYGAQAAKLIINQKGSSANSMQKEQNGPEESTFWSRNLLHQVDLSSFKKFKLAGDFFLWHTFSRHSRLYILNAIVSSFTHHGDHLSDSKAKYIAEFNQIVGASKGYKHIFAPFAILFGLLFKTVRIPSRLYSRLSGVINP